MENIVKKSILSLIIALFFMFLGTFAVRAKETSTLSINTNGNGQIAVAPESGTLEYDDEFPIQSTGVTIKGTYKIGAKADEGWKFIKWTKDGEDYSTSSEETITLGETNVNMVAVFELDETETNSIEELLSSLSNEEKIALMIMPAFRKPSVGNINNDNIVEIISDNEFAGVILFAENTPDIESTMRFVDLLQNANKDHNTRLLIAIDQEGGYVARLGVGTTMPGNMALTATGNPSNAYDAANIIGEELRLLGINTNFAPVVDVNSNPANPVIGVRSFSDDAETVAKFAEQFMEGLHSQGIITSLKHFPGHGDTSTDTHTGLSIIEKNYDELKESELVPFQKLIDSGTEMIMTAHIQYPNIETETYVSEKDGETYTVPATLSKKILTDIIRDDMGFEGVIVTDALDMGAIAKQFTKVDASIRAINAGADILLMPFIYDKDKVELKAYIQTLASKIGTEIDEDRVNESVRRILKLKQENGLFESYDNSYLEQDISAAKSLISSREKHNEEFQIAKKAITMIKNNDKLLPLSGEEKTVVLYRYTSHIEAVNNAITLLKKDGTEINEENITLVPYYSGGWISYDTLKSQVEEAKNIVILNSLYSPSALSDSNLNNLINLIDYAHENNKKVVFMSTHLPYDVAKFKDADAIVLTYLANGVNFKLEDYEKELPKHGPNVMAGIYMLFSQKSDMNGVLPANIYGLDNDDNFTSDVLYSREFGLKYLKSNEDETNVNNNEVNSSNEEKDIINNPKTGDSIIYSISMLGLSIIGLILSSICAIKKRFN